MSQRALILLLGLLRPGGVNMSPQQQKILFCFGLFFEEAVIEGLEMPPDLLISVG